MRQAIGLIIGLALVLAFMGGGTHGTVALADGDGDGVPDAADQCPSLAEDGDGAADLDGCPDTDASVSVVKDEAFAVTMETAETRTVDIWVENGNYPADLIVHALAVSTVGACEVTFIPAPGDGTFPLVTDEDGDTNPDTYFSLLEWEVSLGAGESLHTSRDYEIVCHALGQQSFEIQVDVVPLPPVEEEDVEDLANVHKNFPVVTVEAESGLDSDGDGFSDEVESHVGTEPLSACAATSAPDDEEPDALPPDFDDDQSVNILDVVQMTPPTFNTSAGDPSFSQRKDLFPDGSINILDVVQMTPPVFGTSCP